MENKLTIVVSTRNINNSSEIKKNISKNIGIKDFNILIYENNGKYSLSEIYNKGFSDSNTDIIVFVHDDVDILTKNWGKIILEHVNSTDFGILGVAGSTELRKDAIWWRNTKTLAGNVVHLHENKKKVTQYSNNFQNKVVETVLVDGLYIVTHRKRIKSQFLTDFTGFHFYDISFCIENFINNVKIGVVSNIELLHKSIGNINDSFLKEKSYFLYKYDKFLPIKSEITLDYINKTISNQKNKPKTAIVIPHIGKTDKLTKLIESIFKFDTKNINIYIADTGSNQEDINNLNILCKKYNIFLIKYNYYNFAKINNDMVFNKIDNDTELLLFMNNDVELVNDAINILINTYQQNKQTTGTIGCRLHFPDNTIQHGGVILLKNKDNYIFTHKNYKSSYQYYNNVSKNIIGNTGAFLLTPYNLFKKIGGFNTTYKECYEDVEYNLQCILNGKTNIFCGNAVAYHYESLTRGTDNKSDKEFEDYNNLIKFLKNNLIKLNKYVINT